MNINKLIKDIGDGIIEITMISSVAKFNTDLDAVHYRITKVEQDFNELKYKIDRLVSKLKIIDGALNDIDKELFKKDIW